MFHSLDESARPNGRADSLARIAGAAHVRDEAAHPRIRDGARERHESSTRAPQERQDSETIAPRKGYKPRWPFLAALGTPLTCLYESLCLKYNTLMTFVCYFWHFLLPASIILCVSNTLPQPFLCRFCHLLSPAFMILCVSNALSQWSFFAIFGTSSYLPL